MNGLPSKITFFTEDIHNQERLCTNHLQDLSKINDRSCNTTPLSCSDSSTNTIHKKKPLPQIPPKRNTTSEIIPNYNNSTTVHYPFINHATRQGGVVTGPSWTVTTPMPMIDRDNVIQLENREVNFNLPQKNFNTTVEIKDNNESQYIVYNEHNNNRNIKSDQELLHNPLSDELFQQQVHYFNSAPYSNGYYDNQTTYSSVNSHHSSSCESINISIDSTNHRPFALNDNVAFDTNQEWKISTFRTMESTLCRSENSKTETKDQVTHLNQGPQLFKDTMHYEKPFEPSTKKITNTEINKPDYINEVQHHTLLLQRKLSKEEISNMSEASKSVSCLQRLNCSSDSTEDIDLATASANITTLFLSSELHNANSSGTLNDGSSSSIPSFVSSVDYQLVPLPSTFVYTKLPDQDHFNKQRTTQNHSSLMPRLTIPPSVEQEEAPCNSFFASEKYFQQPDSASPISATASRIPSPWGSASERQQQSMGRISTVSIPISSVHHTAQVPDEVSHINSSTETTTTTTNTTTTTTTTMEKNKSQKETLSNENTSKAERNFINIHVNQETNNDTITNYNEASLSIASCSLIQIQSNIKLYRRMALKTQNEDIQMTYAKYLLQIAKLYNKQGFGNRNGRNTIKKGIHGTKKGHTYQQLETPEQTRHRLLSEAAYWIVRLAKAKKPEALFIKGRWCLLGPEAEECVIRGYEKTQENKAFKCFLSASKGGWTEAHYELAQLWKIRGKFAKAIQYYEKGAKENHTLSIYKMAKILLRGQLKHKVDIPRGMAYLKQAADMNDFASAEPAFVLGCIYAHEFDCIGIQRYAESISKQLALDSATQMEKSYEKVNYPLALTYLKKSCQKGYPDALYFMGQILETGKLGQLSDSWQAYQYYVKAADADHVGAMLDLSRIYSQGIPGLLAAQKEIAFKWCSKAADLGFDQAEYVLGKYYENGIGVNANFPRALEYYGRAASKGYQPAAEKLNRPLTNGSSRKEPQATEKKSIIAKENANVDQLFTNRDDKCKKSSKKINLNSTKNNICNVQ